MFCGTFDAKGTDLEIGAGRLTIKRHGEVGKLVRQVEQITYSGREALQARAGGRSTSPSAPCSA